MSGDVEAIAKRHNLKCWPEPFAAMWSGAKTAEFRPDDRSFKVGDTLVLHEWCPAKGHFEGPKITRRITHILRNSFGVPDGYAMLSLASDEAETLRGLWQDAMDDHQTSETHHPRSVLIPTETFEAAAAYLRSNP